MQKEQVGLIPAVYGALGFIARNQAELPRAAVSKGKQMLDEVAAQFPATATTQDAKTRDVVGGVAVKEQLRTVLLRDHLRPIAAVAQLLAPEVPQLAGIKLPNPNMGMVKLVNAARGIAATVAPHVDTLVAAGLPATVVSGLTDAATALEGAETARRADRAARVNQTRAMKAARQKVAQALTALDKLVRSDLANNPGALEEWNSLRRLASGRSRGAATPAASAASAAPVAPVAPVAPAAPAAPVVATTTAIPAAAEVTATK